MDWAKIEKPFFTLFIAAILAGAIQVARGWSIRASIIILVLGAIGLVLALAQFLADLKGLSSGGSNAALTMEAPASQPASRWGNPEIWAWIIGFFVAIQIIGFLAAVPLFTFCYTKGYGGGWVLSALLAVTSWGFVYLLFDILLHVPWPEPLISVFF